MIIRIAIEVVIAIVLVMIGNTFWEFPKRAKFLKRAISDQQFLLTFLTPVTLDSLPPAITAYADHCDGNYMASIVAVADADRVSQRRLKLVMGTVVVALLVGSYFLGPAYLLVGIGVFLFSGLGSIGSAARTNALDHILALSYLLHRWHLADPTGCEKWVEQAYTLKPLYSVVKIWSAAWS
jgi:hypothetical protein